MDSENGFKLTVESYSIGNGEVSCKKLRQAYTASDVEKNVSTCLDYGSHHWYGAAEVNRSIQLNFLTIVFILF